MKAITLDRFGDTDILELTNLPVPQIGEEDVLINVKAAGINPVDWKIRKGLLQGRLPHQFPIIPGWDAAGIVEKVGSKVTRFKTGDEVMSYTRKAVIQWGTYAEYVVVPEENVAKKPSNLSFGEAAAIPLAALTAYQCLFDAIQLEAGQTILIHAGAGGVGGYAIQLAKRAGAHVITTASQPNHPYVEELGADEVIDYTRSDFRKAVLKSHPEGIDAVFDMIGGDVQEKSYDVLRPGGHLVSILALQNQQAWEMRGFKVHYVFVAPNAAQLEELSAMAEAGALKVHLSHQFTLEQAAKAQELSESGHVRGKLVLIV